MIPALVVAALSDPPQYLQDIANEVTRDMGIDVTLTVETCHQENAWYTLESHDITLCREILDRPLLASAILRHELGHAIDFQLGLGGVDYETFADEFMGLTATQDELAAVGTWFLNLALADHRSGDPHPPALDRAWVALCFADQSDDIGCEVYKRSVRDHWMRLLAL